LKTCKVKLEKEKNKDKIDIKEEIKEQLLEILKKECKMHPKTLQKINKQLMQQNNSGNINNGTINNINNYNIIQLGDENLLDVLSKKEQIMILNKKHQSLNHMIEYVHFNNNFPQYKNIAITNMKDGLAYMYDKDKNKFIAIKKEELLNTVIEMRMLDIEEFYSNNEDELDPKTKVNIKKIY
jgi:transcriptional regulator NrdR family protein